MANNKHHAEISPWMHYTVFIALIISLITTFLLGILLTEVLFGTGLKYFATVKETSPLRTHRAGAQIAGSGPELPYVGITTIWEGSTVHDLVIQSDNLPFLTYRQSYGRDGYLMSFKCFDVFCEDGIENVINDRSNIFSGAEVYELTDHAMTLMKGDIPVVAFHQQPTSNRSYETLIMSICDDTLCNSTADQQLDGSVTIVEATTSNTGKPVIVYASLNTQLTRDVNVLTCQDAKCKKITHNVIDTSARTYRIHDIDVAVGKDNLPVISLHKYSQLGVTGRNIDVIKCADSACSESTKSTLYQSDDLYFVGTQIAVDRNNIPSVIFYSPYGFGGGLFYTRCGDVSCSQSKTKLLTGPYYGRYSDLAFDQDGVPVIAYSGDHEDDLLIMKCGDENCSSQSAVVIEDNDSGSQIGLMELAINKNNYPSVLYDSGGRAKFAQCLSSSCMRELVEFPVPYDPLPQYPIDQTFETLN